MSARMKCVNDTDGDGNCAACARNPEAPCRMSARTGIRANLGMGGMSTDGADALLDAYAHELAEKILELRSTVPGLMARPSWRDGYDAALVVAAATIAPEVSSDD